MDNIFKLKSHIIFEMYNWCVNNGLVPYIVVHLSKETKGLESFTESNLLPLNINPSAVINLNFFDEHIQFETRFNKVSTLVTIPLGNIVSVYPREHPEYGIGFLVDLDNKNFNATNNNKITKETPTVTNEKPKSILSIVKN